MRWSRITSRLANSRPNTPGRVYTAYVSDIVVSAIITGFVSGLVGGAVTSTLLHIRWSHSSRAQGSAQTVTGRGNQTALAGTGGQAAQSRRGNVNQSITNLNPERRAQLTATVVYRTDRGMPLQFLTIQNIGELAAEDLTVAPPPDGGGFTTQPNWTHFPHRLEGGQTAETTCLTSGSGLVRVVVTFREGEARVGPIILEAPHRSDHSI